MSLWPMIKEKLFSLKWIQAEDLSLLCERKLEEVGTPPSAYPRHRSRPPQGRHCNCWKVISLADSDKVYYDGIGHLVY